MVTSFDYRSWLNLVQYTISTATREELEDAKTRGDDMPPMIDDDLDKPWKHKLSPSDRVEQYRERLHSRAAARRVK